MVRVTQYAALLLLVYLAWRDIQTMAIPNKVIWPAMGVGMVYFLIFRISEAPQIALAVLFFFLAGCLGASGWGDIKVTMLVTLTWGWKCALFGYVLAQLLFFGFYFIRSPKKIIRELFSCQIKGEGKPVAQTERPFVPFFLAAILIIILFGRFLL